MPFISGGRKEGSNIKGRKMKVCEVTVKKSIKERIAYMECVIQGSMFYSFDLFLSILLCHVDSALVSDSNASM